jgi:hypothetical protein
MSESGDWIPREWLGGEASVEQIEAKELQGCNEQHLAEWRSFISKMQPGDQLKWFFSTDESWLALARRAGYAIVRQGEVVGSFVTLLN